MTKASQRIYTLIALSKIEIFVHKTAEQAVKLYKDSHTFIIHEFVIQAIKSDTSLKTPYREQECIHGRGKEKKRYGG